MVNDDKDNIIYSYTDQQAVNDGVIHKLGFIHRVTNNALVEIKNKYSYDDYYETLKFIHAELIPLITLAFKTYNKGSILKTNYNFKVGNFKHTQILWFIPNEQNGITIMKPEDY